MNVLFLCTGNSARSILGEVIFNDLFAEFGKAYSAGSKPTGTPNPIGLQTLTAHGHNIEGLASQNVLKFADHDINLVISVCANAENECAIWPGGGNPKRLHWPLPDPKTREDFETVYVTLKEKLETYLAK